MSAQDKYKQALRLLLTDLYSQMSRPAPVYGDSARVAVTMPLHLYEEIIRSARSAMEPEL